MSKAIGINKKVFTFLALLLLIGGVIYIHAEGSGYISSSDAKAIAVKDAGVSERDVIFKKIEFEKKDHMAGYELKFSARGNYYFYFIDAVNGSIIKKSNDITGKNVSITSESYLSLDEAKAVVVNHAGLSMDDVHFDDIDLDHKDNRAVYKMEFRAIGYEYEYIIDAVTGEVVGAEIEKD